MTILFYRTDGRDADRAASFPSSLTVRTWRPGLDGPPPPGPHRGENLAWRALDRLGLFGRRDFAELSIWHGTELAHRLVITPKWFRFPFMAEDDLQIGAVWTPPVLRGQGLARAGIGHALAEIAARPQPAPRVWYVTDANNLASVRLAEACGFALVGEGRRTRPLGVAAVGRFRLNNAARTQVSGSDRIRQAEDCGETGVRQVQHGAMH